MFIGEGVYLWYLYKEGWVKFRDQFVELFVFKNRLKCCVCYYCCFKNRNDVF